jgi:hypothetical protein
LYRVLVFALCVMSGVHYPLWANRVSRFERGFGQRCWFELVVMGNLVMGVRMCRHGADKHHENGQENRSHQPATVSQDLPQSLLKRSQSDSFRTWSVCRKTCPAQAQHEQ